jgi:hypothetical protein
MHRPNNPYPEGTTQAAFWELDAEMTHFGRVLLLRMHKFVTSVNKALAK